jgi:hypothetical protein
MSLKIPKDFKKRLQKLEDEPSTLIKKAVKQAERNRGVQEIKAEYRKLKYRLAKAFLKGIFKLLRDAF